MQHHHRQADEIGMPLVEHAVQLATAPYHLDLDAAIQSRHDSTDRGDRATRGAASFNQRDETLTDSRTLAQIRLAPAAAAPQRPYGPPELCVIHRPRMAPSGSLALGPSDRSWPRMISSRGASGSRPGIHTAATNGQGANG
jgi:hypothetical protein